MKLKLHRLKILWHISQAYHGSVNKNVPIIFLIDFFFYIFYTNEILLSLNTAPVGNVREAGAGNGKFSFLTVTEIIMNEITINIRSTWQSKESNWNMSVMATS